jgi:hypothetical protein
MRKQLILTIIGITVLVLFCCLLLSVKYGWLPTPTVEAANVEGRSIQGILYEVTVPATAVIESQPHYYVYTLQKLDHYWLNDLYAIPREVNVIHTDGKQTAISFVEPNINLNQLRVVKAPDTAYKEKKLVRLATR